MADYRTEFSVLLPLRSQEESDAALKIYHEHEERSQHDDDAVGIGFNAEQMFGSTDLCLWSGGDGDTEQVIAYVRDCAKALGLTGRVGFQWVSTCSRPRPDGFDSGVIVLDLATGETLDWMSGQQWLAAHLVTSRPASAPTRWSLQSAWTSDRSAPMMGVVSSSCERTVNRPSSLRPSTTGSIAASVRPKPSLDC